MQPVPIVKVGASSRAGTTLLKKRAFVLCIWGVAAAVTLSHGTKQFFQPLQQNHGTKQFFQPLQQNQWELPSQLRFRAKTDNWSPFSPPEQQTLSWPFGGDSHSGPTAVTASNAATFIGIVVAISMLASTLLPVPAVVEGIRDDGALGALSRDVKSGYESSPVTSSRFSMLSAVGTDGTSTTKGLAKQVTQGMQNKDMYAGSELAGIFDEGPDDDVTVYTEFADTQVC